MSTVRLYRRLSSKNQIPQQFPHFRNSTIPKPNSTVLSRKTPKSVTTKIMNYRNNSKRWILCRNLITNIRRKKNHNNNNHRRRIIEFRLGIHLRKMFTLTMEMVICQTIMEVHRRNHCHAQVEITASRIREALRLLRRVDRTTLCPNDRRCLDRWPDQGHPQRIRCDFALFSVYGFDGWRSVLESCLVFLCFLCLIFGSL